MTIQDRIFRILLPLKEIPLDSEVTKVTGTNVFTVKDKVIIYGNPKQEIKASAKTRFLIGKNATDINSHSEDEVFVWHVPLGHLMDYLDEKYHEEDDHN